MQTRPRVDLDGVVLRDAERPGADAGPALVVFRYRTTEGLVLMVPESGDFTVPWEHVASADLDLAAGTVRVAFTDGFADGRGWLRGARTLAGAWTDRFTMGPR